MLKWQEDRRECDTNRLTATYCSHTEPVLLRDGEVVGRVEPYGRGVWQAFKYAQLPNGAKRLVLIGSVKGKGAAKKMLKEHFQAPAA